MSAGDSAFIARMIGASTVYGQQREESEESACCKGRVSA